jgi:hypothetical protein
MANLAIEDESTRQTVYRLYFDGLRNDRLAFYCQMVISGHSKCGNEGINA